MDHLWARLGARAMDFFRIVFSKLWRGLSLVRSSSGSGGSNSSGSGFLKFWGDVPGTRCILVPAFRVRLAMQQLVVFNAFMLLVPKMSQTFCTPTRSSNMRQTCPTHATNVFQPCRRYVQHVSNTCPTYVQYTRDTYSKHVLNIYSRW